MLDFEEQWKESAKVGDVSFKLREGREELIALVESLVR